VRLRPVVDDARQNVGCLDIVMALAIFLLPEG
jgi:hypothetical protein